MIAFQRVKKSPLVIRTVDRIKINFCEKLFPFRKSELSHTFCKVHISTYFTSVCVYFPGDRSVMDKSSSATCLLYSDHRCCERGPKSHVAKEISRRGRRRSREKGNQGVGDFLFINILQLFSIYFIIFFQLNFTLSFFSILFFTHDIYPHPGPRTHNPQPLPTTHDI